MNIASLDPGVTTGLVIARVLIAPRTVYLEPVVCRQDTDANAVLGCVLRHRCFCVVIEQRPRNASKEGTDSYEFLLQGLVAHGFRDSRHFTFVHNSIIRISPGHWKPVMQAQIIRDRGSWQVDGQPHLLDALNLLHYAVKVNNLSKEVCYE